MKQLLRIVLLLLFIQPTYYSQAQNKREKRQQDRHLSEYEELTLEGSNLPVLMPYNRWIDPAGFQLYFGDNQLENHAMDCAASPDGKWIAVEGRYSIVILSAENNKIIEHTTLKNLIPENLMNTFSGISWQKTGENYELYWSASGDKSYVIIATWNGRKIKLANLFEFPAEPSAKNALPNEVALSEEKGTSYLYVVLNGNNRLEKLNAETGETIWSVTTGVAPYGVIKTAGKIYVTNWAGTVPEANDNNVAGIPWGKVCVFMVKHAYRSLTEMLTGNRFTMDSKMVINSNSPILLQSILFTIY